MPYLTSRGRGRAPDKRWVPVSGPTLGRRLNHFISIEFTIRIQRQQGRAFYGITQSKRASEQFVGVVGLDKSIYFADPEGYYVGTLLASNKLELVYLEAGRKLRVAGYAVLKRVR